MTINKQPDFFKPGPNRKGKDAPAVDGEPRGVNEVFYLGEAEQAATVAKTANCIFDLDKNGGSLPMLLIIMRGIL